MTTAAEERAPSERQAQYTDLDYQEGLSTGYIGTLLDISTTAARRYVNEGILPARKLGGHWYVPAPAVALAIQHGLLPCPPGNMVPNLGLNTLASMSIEEWCAKQLEWETIIERRRRRIDWHALARFEARDAHVNNFPSRRGTNVYDDTHVTAIYDNNPWPDPTLRPRQWAYLRDWLRDEGIEELAFASYPTADETTDPEEIGYTEVMVIDAGWDQLSRVRRAIHDILGRVLGDQD